MQKYMHLNVHSSITYHNQDLEATQVPIDRRMNKEDAIYISLYIDVDTHILQYYSVIKKRTKFCHLQHGGTWRDLEVLGLVK